MNIDNDNAAQDTPENSNVDRVGIDEHDTFVYDYFKAENTKIINEKINDESQLKIVQDLYNQCDTLNTSKLNLIKNLENERKQMNQDAERNENVRSKLQMDKELLQRKIAKYTEHFDQFKVALDVCANNIEDFKKTVQGSEESITEFKREENQINATNRRKIEDIKQKVEEQKEINKMEIKMASLKQQNEQIIQLKVQRYNLQQSLKIKEENKSKKIEEIKQLCKGTSEFSAEFIQLEEKYKNVQLEFENKKMQCLNIIEKFNAESIVDKEKITNLEVKRENLQSIFDHQNNVMTETQEEYYRTELSVSDFEESVSALKTDILDLEAQFNEQKTKLVDRLTISEQNMNASEAKCKREEEKHILLKKQLEEYKSIFEQKSLNLKNKRADSEKLRDKLNKIKTQKQEDDQIFSKTINELTTQINNIDTDKELLMKKYENMVADLETKKVALAKITSAKNTTINNYKMFENKSQTKLSKLRKENIKLEDNMDKLQSDIEHVKKLAKEKDELHNTEYTQKIKLVSEENEKMKKTYETTLNKKRTEIEMMTEQIKNMELVISELKTGKEGVQNELDKKVRELLNKTQLNDIDILRDASQLQIPSVPDSHIFDYPQPTPKIDTKMTLRRRLCSQRVSVITSDSDSEYFGVPIKDKKDLTLPTPNDESPMFKRPVMRKPTKEVKKRKPRK